MFIDYFNCHRRITEGGLGNNPGIFIDLVKPET